MAGDQNVALMLMQVLFGISRTWRMNLWPGLMYSSLLLGYFEKKAIPRINGYFVIAVSMH